ncbi:hypothetical protein A2526_04500 [candidate division WOR-1 bacterium RIFOXYD2_FULL_36_8]|uniref:Fe/B12 periplasmic-binding domain-containing protein n=1 Tax=candidate division WOR-1 bacterium RIFOXYB2_FULL_36_35 TaxID=1802578 RepID=A0A1F4RYS5_UNCSA|nr:MAG: hypothetical protein A2230_01205 [candidate division WOR-1 bacterium RIFOXYA2_FULL_36_21]OGC13332.1 MAG: hypothetical protein A2290_04695 [candidate division WOR-1 bacterium RIFOXYB2_FULL_36_35]OGC21039.1 MAG: hypothetical protein A2282_08460 [candidate division WOR-1 bacterium RIFOXYA12_FULL_36_13]OGC39133.1 MAG: hypothetical protein A2526_04500 [candidate division WOR-1 bacterium RIFOXYD2_FULL_36_8]
MLKPFNFIYRNIVVLIGVIFLCSTASAFPSRIISTMPSITEILFALGLQSRVVGVTTNCDYPKEAKTKEKIGRVAINLEKVFYLKPDLIIMLEEAQGRNAEFLRSKGLPVATISSKSIEDVLISIKVIGALTGVTKEADILVAKLDKRLTEAKNKNKKDVRQSVFVMVGFKPLVSVGESSFINDILLKAGGENVVVSDVAYPQLNFEELYRLDPDFLIVPSKLFDKKNIKKEEKLRKLSAVQNDRILFVNDDILFRAGPRVVDAVEIIAKFLANEDQ